MDDPLQKCLAWVELHQKGLAGRRKAFDPLLKSGIAELQGRTVVLKDAQTLGSILDSQCKALIQARDQAEQIMQSMGLDINISSHPLEALVLVRKLEQLSLAPEKSCHVQALSSALYQDSKHILNIPVLRRIYSAWSAAGFQRGELRLKAWSEAYCQQGLFSLRQATLALGQICLPAARASRIQDFDFDQISLVLTSENLAPFLELEFDHGLLMFCPGYAAALPALWLKNLPSACTWIHLGDFDPDGLYIFENLSRMSGRTGKFFPDIPTLEKLGPSLPAWTAARGFEPDRYRSRMCQYLASGGREHGRFAD